MSHASPFTAWCDSPPTPDVYTPSLHFKLSNYFIRRESTSYLPAQDKFWTFFHFDPLRSLKTIVNGPSSSTGSYTFHTARHFHLKAFLRRSEWKQMHVDIMLSITLCISETAELDKMLPCICGHPMAQHDGYNGRASVPCDISLTQNSNSHFDRDWL